MRVLTSLSSLPLLPAVLNVLISRLTAPLRGVALSLLLALAAGLAQAAPPLQLGDETRPAALLPALEYLLDADGRLGLDQVAADDAKFLPARPDARYLTGNGSLWLRFDAVVDKPEVRWRLTVPLPGLDKATLYYRDAGGQWVEQRAGDTRAVNGWSQPGRYPIFSLAHEARQPVRYYLQIQHPRIPFSTLPRVVSDVELVNANQSEHMLLGIYFGLAALVVILALVNAAAYRDSGFGTYAIYIGVFAASQAAFTGVAALYAWPGWSNASAAVVILLPSAAASAMWFVRTVTMPRRFAPWLDRLMLGLMLVLPLAGIADSLTVTPTGYAVMNALVGASLLVTLSVVGVALAAGDYHTRWVAAGFLPVLLCTLFPLLRNLGLIGTSALTDYALLFGSAIEVPILFYGLLRRVAQRRGLSTRASGLRSTDPLTGLDATPAFEAKLQQSLAVAERYRLPFALLVVNLVNHAGLQKSHGRETADRAIVMAAARIRGIAHSTDTLARVGETQFALLIEGPIDAAGANDAATRILAAGLRPSRELPDAEPLQFHIAVGHVEGTAQATPAQARACLDRLRQAADGLNDGTRRAIRLISL